MIKFFVWGAATACICISSTLAQPFGAGTYLTGPYGPNGTWNLYQVGPTPLPWVVAVEAAQKSPDPTGGDKTGHLVTIGSAAEDMFIYQYVRGDFIWIGLTDDEKYGGSEAGTDGDGGWAWVNKEPVGKRFWRSTEPDSGDPVGEDAVAIGVCGRWLDFPNGLRGNPPITHPYVIEWDTGSPEPVKVPGVNVITMRPMMPDNWPAEFNTMDMPGEGPWRVVRAMNLDGRSLISIWSTLCLPGRANLIPTRMPRLNYHHKAGEKTAFGWLPVGDLRPLPVYDNSGAIHFATVHLEKAGTWTFDVHGDDFFAVRFPGLKWKTANGMGDIDPLDASTIYLDSATGDGTVLGVIDLPAGDSKIEVLLGNRGADCALQVLAAPGSHAQEGATDQWRDPGHKSAGNLAWPGINAAGWTVTRADRTPDTPKINTLMEGLALLGTGKETKVEGVERINYIDSGAAADTEYPNPVPFPGDKPGEEDGFAVKATGKLVIAKDGVYQIGAHSEDKCAMRIKGGQWKTLTRDTGYAGVIEGDTIYSPGVEFYGTSSQIIGEIELTKGEYDIEALFVDNAGPAGFAVVGAPAGNPPRLLAKDGAKIDKDIDGLPLLMPSK